MIPREDTHPAAADDAGITLIELILYALLAAVILAGIGALFVNAWVSQTQTTNRDAATGAAAAFSATLTKSIRNASDFRVDDGTTVRAVVAVGTTDWECQAFTLTETGSVVHTRSDAEIPVGSTAGWAELASGVTGTLAGGALFAEVPAAAGPGQLRVGYTAELDDQSVTVSDGVTAQATIPGSGPCW